MFRLIVVTLAAFVAVLQIFGDPARKPEVARAAPEGLTLASFVGVADQVEETPLVQPLDVSDSEAVKIALAASRAARNERLGTPPVRRGALAREIEVISEAQELAPESDEATVRYWYVSGSKVNLRQGPGTGNAVIAQVTLGTEAMVLDQQDGWMQIQTVDGGTSGWIFGKFLNEQKPG